MAECTQMYLCNPAHRYMYFRVWSIASTYMILYLRASASIDSIASQPAKLILYMYTAIIMCTAYIDVCHTTDTYNI